MLKIEYNSSVNRKYGNMIYFYSSNNSLISGYNIDDGVLTIFSNQEYRIMNQEVIDYISDINCKISEFHGIGIKTIK